MLNIRHFILFKLYLLELEIHGEYKEQPEICKQPSLSFYFLFSHKGNRQEIERITLRASIHVTRYSWPLCTTYPTLVLLPAEGRAVVRTKSKEKEEMMVYI